MLEHVIAALRRQRLGTTNYDDTVLLAPIALRPLSGGRNNAVYAATVDQQQVVLKCYKVDARQRAHKERAALLLAKAQGCDTAPRLLTWSDDPQVPIAALQLLPGRDLGGVNLTPCQLEALAEALSSLYPLADLACVERADSAARTQLETMQHTITALPVATGTPYMLDYVERLARDSDDDIWALWREWQRGPDLALLRAPVPPVFSRGDPNLANCLWDGARVRIADFEYAGVSDRAFDLADLVEHQQSRATPDAAWAQFVDLFPLSGWELERLHAARRLLRLFWLLKFRAFGAMDTRYLAQRERMRLLA